MKLSSVLKPVVGLVLSPITVPLRALGSDFIEFTEEVNDRFRLGWAEIGRLSEQVAFIDDVLGIERDLGGESTQDPDEVLRARIEEVFPEFHDEVAAARQEVISERLDAHEARFGAHSDLIGSLQLLIRDAHARMERALAAMPKMDPAEFIVEDLRFDRLREELEAKLQRVNDGFGELVTTVCNDARRAVRDELRKVDDEVAELRKELRELELQVQRGAERGARWEAPPVGP